MLKRQKKNQSDVNMKILHISTENTWRGGERQLVLLHSELSKAGTDSLVIARKSSPVAEICRKEGLSCLQIPIGSAYDLKAAWNIRNIARKEKADILHAHTSKGHTLAILANIMAASVPVVLSRRVDFPVKSNFLSLYKYNSHFIRKIICVSDEIKKITAPSIRDKEKLITIHSGVDIDKFSDISDLGHFRNNFDIPENISIIGNTSALADHKDYYTFVDTAVAVHKRNADTHFFIVGDGPLEAELRKYVNEKSAESYITFTGFIEEIGLALKSLDIFLFTSKTEGLGTSVLDAMAAGIPVVATKAGGVPEMIKHDYNGLLCPVGSTHCLTTSVERLLKDNALKMKLLENAKKTIVGFSYQKTAKKTLSIYHEILNNNKSI